MVGAEVGHKVVDGVTLWRIESGLHLVIQLLLSSFHVLDGVLDGSVLAEVGDEVVYLPVRLLPGALGGLLVPWSSSRKRSVLHLDSLSIAGEECKYN
jgi:hypothetical protein